MRNLNEPGQEHPKGCALIWPSDTYTGHHYQPQLQLRIVSLLHSGNLQDPWDSEPHGPALCLKQACFFLTSKMKISELPSTERSSCIRQKMLLLKLEEPSDTKDMSTRLQRCLALFLLGDWVWGFLLFSLNSAPGREHFHGIVESKALFHKHTALTKTPCHQGSVGDFCSHQLSNTCSHTQEESQNMHFLYLFPFLSCRPEPQYLGTPRYFSLWARIHFWTKNQNKCLWFQNLLDIDHFHQ